MNATCDVMRSDTCKSLHHPLPTGSIVNLHHKAVVVGRIATDDLQTHKTSSTPGPLGSSFHKMYSTPCLLKTAASASPPPNTAPCCNGEIRAVGKKISIPNGACESSDVEGQDFCSTSLTTPLYDHVDSESNALLPDDDKETEPEPSEGAGDALALVPYESPKIEATGRAEVRTADCGGLEIISWLVYPPTPASALEYCNSGVEVKWGSAYSDASNDANVVMNNTLLGPFPFSQEDYENGLKNLSGNFADVPIPASIPLLLSLHLPPLPMLNLMDGLIDKDRLLKLSQTILPHGPSYPLEVMGERLLAPSYPTPTPWYDHFQSPPSSNPISPLIFSIIDPKMSPGLPLPHDNSYFPHPPACTISGVLVSSSKSNNALLTAAALPKFQFKMRKKDNHRPYPNKPPLNDQYDHIAAAAAMRLVTSPVLTNLCCPFRDEMVMCCDQAHNELPLYHQDVSMGGFAPSPPLNNTLIVGPVLPPPPPPSCCLTPSSPTPMIMCPDCLPTPLPRLLPLDQEGTFVLFCYTPPPLSSHHLIGPHNSYAGASRPSPTTFMLPPPNHPHSYIPPFYSQHPDSIVPVGEGLPEGETPFESLSEPIFLLSSNSPDCSATTPYLFNAHQPPLGPPQGPPLFEPIPFFLPPHHHQLLGGDHFILPPLPPPTYLIDPHHHPANQAQYYAAPHLDYGPAGDVVNNVTGAAPSKNCVTYNEYGHYDIINSNGFNGNGGNYAKHNGSRGRKSSITTTTTSKSSNNSTTTTANGSHKGSGPNGSVRAAGARNNSNGGSDDDDDDERRDRRRPTDYSNAKRRNHAQSSSSIPTHHHHRIPESPDYGLGSDAESSVNHAENEEVSPLVLILSSIQEVTVYDITECCARVRWKALPVGQSEQTHSAQQARDGQKTESTPVERDHQGTPTPTLISLPAAPIYRVYLFTTTTTSTRASFPSKRGGPGRGNFSAGLLCPPPYQAGSTGGDSATSLLNAQPGDGTCVYSGPFTECSIQNLCPFKEYEICVAATLNNLRGRLTRAVLFKTLSTIPEAPTPPVLSLKGKNLLTIKWVNPADNGSKITAYTLQSAPCPETGDLPRTEELADLYVGLSKQFKATKLKPATAYAFRLAASNSHGTSPWSSLVIFWTSGSTPIQPKAPELIKAGPDFLTLSWERQASTHGINSGNGSHLTEPGLGFTLQMEDCATGHGFVTLYNSSYQAAATPAGKNVDPGKPILYTTPSNLIHRNSTYNFRLRTCNEEGYSPWSDVVSFASTPAPPTPPKKLGVKGKAQPTYLKITWAPPTDDGGSPVEYVLQMKSRDQPKYETVYDGGLEREAACQNLAPGSFYVFRARCKSQAGFCSGWSDEFMVCTPATLPSPCLVPLVTSCCAQHSHKSKAASTPGSTLYSLALRWGPPELDGGSPISEYELQMTTGLNEAQTGGDQSINNECVSYKTIYQGPANEFYINDLAPVVRYNFRLRCANVIGWSQWSKPQSHITGNGTPGAPGQPILTIRSSFAIAVCYAEPEQINGSPVKEYVLEARCSSLKLEPSSSLAVSTIGSDLSKIYQGADLTFECKSLEPCQTYEFRVSALNEMGQGPWSTVASITLPPAVPTAIGGSTLSLVKVHSHWAEISWLEPDARGSPILRYAVEIAETQHVGAAKATTLCETEGNACFYHIPDLLPLHPYRVRVQAINGVGVGPFSAPIKFTTLSRTPTTPPTFKGFEGQNTISSNAILSSRCVKLRWDYETGDSGAAKTTFELEMADYRKNFNLIYTGDNTSYKITKLVENSSYYFRIRALNESGFGPYSSILTFKTAWAPPHPIKNIKIVRCKPDSCHISWSYPLNHHQHLYLQDPALVREPSADPASSFATSEEPASDAPLPVEGQVLPTAQLTAPTAWNVVFKIYLAAPDPTSPDAQLREIVDLDIPEDSIPEEQGFSYKLVHTCSETEFTFKHLHPSTAHKVRVQPVRIFSRAIMLHDDQTPLYSIQGLATDPLVFQTPPIPSKLPTLADNGNDSHPAVIRGSRLATVINALSQIPRIFRLGGLNPSSMPSTGAVVASPVALSQNCKKGTPKNVGKSHPHLPTISSSGHHPKPVSSKKGANTFPPQQPQQLQQKFSLEQRWALIIMGAFVLLAIGTTFAVAYVGQFL